MKNNKNSFNYTISAMISLLMKSILMLVVFAFGCIVMPVANAEIVSPNDWVLVPKKPDPMLDNLTIPADATTKGMWSSLYDWPMNGLHLTILPDGRAVSYGTTLNGGAQIGRHIDIWDPSLGFDLASSHVTTEYPTMPSSFCTAATFLSDGRLMISGASTDLDSGLTNLGIAKSTSFLDPVTNTVTTSPATLALDRWYATLINLPDGRPLMMGGMAPYTENEMRLFPDESISLGYPSMTPEIFENGAWRSLMGAQSRDAFGPDFLRTSYPRAWVAPNGKVFGISAEKMWYLDADANGGNGAVTNVYNFKQGYAQFQKVNVGATNTAVMYAPGKVIQVGGNGGYNADGLPASNMATVVDITNEVPVLIEQPRMTHARRYPNAVVLANGQVVVTGGTGLGNSGVDGDGFDWTVLAAEIWDPATESWTVGADAARLRVYHSITALLPNGTVLSTGGGTPGPVLNLNAEVYYPPYLFETVGNSTQLAKRPEIHAISGLSYAPSAPMQIDMTTTDTVSDVVLIGLSNGTHSFNPGQRRIPLTFTQEYNRITTTVPNANLTPPGYYQVVVLNENGVPSLGTIVGIGQNLVPPAVPTTPYNPPEINENVETPLINVGGVGRYTITPLPNVTYSWNFGDGTADTPFSDNPLVEHSYAQAGLYIITLKAKNSENQISQRTFFQAVATGSTPLAPTTSSNIALEVRAGASDRIWVLNPDNDSVSVIDALSKALVATIDVDESPRSVAIAPNGRVWVANKSTASISVINPASLTVVQKIPLPRASQPHGLVFMPDGSAALVALEATGQLLKLNADTGQQIGAVDVGKHARHIAVNGALNKALVSRFITPPLPGEATANISTAGVGGEVVVVNPITMAATTTVLLQHSDKPDAETQGSGIPNYLAAPVISPDGSTAWVPSKQDNIKRGVLRNNQPLDFQNTVRAISSRIDMTTLQEDYAKRIDHDNASVGAAAAYHPSGIYLFVALETSREVAVVNALTGLQLFRIEVGRAPQGLTFSADGNTLYVKEFMDRSVSIFDLTPLTQQGVLSVQAAGTVFTVSEEKLPAQVVLGKQFFYDAKDTRLARDRYMSCASCHNDGEQDGRVWDFTGFGEGLRNTIALKGRAGLGHGFLHWSANFDEVQDFEQVIRNRMGGTGLMSDAQFNAGSRSQPLGEPKSGINADLDNLAAYVTSLNTFAKNPNRNQDGSLSPSAVIGKALFATNCVICHTGAATTNSVDSSTLQNIGTIKQPSSGQRLGSTLTGIDTPTLNDVWKTAPYLHDGSAATISNAIQAHSDITLNASDLANVIAYVNQIGDHDQPPALIGQWPFEEGTGVTVADATGNKALQFSSPNWVAGKIGNSAGLFNGTNVDANASGAVIDTTGSFSVSTWVKLDTLSGWRTIVSQDGSNVSGFALQYSSQQGNKFLFSMSAEDSFTSAVQRATSTTQPVMGEWYHVVAVRDAQASTMKLYVNGQLEATTNNLNNWSADGNFVVGRGYWGGAADWFAGAIDEVSAYNYPITEAEIAALYALGAQNIAPTVSISGPTTVLVVNKPVTLTATAVDTDGEIANVTFNAKNGQQTAVIGTGTLVAGTNNYTLVWTPTEAVSYQLTATATDDAGEVVTSSPVMATVSENNNVLPFVTINSPQEGSAALINTPLVLKANAVDSDGTVTNVQFFATANGGEAVLLGAGVSVTGVDNYGFTWTPTIAGAYQVSAQATDNFGDIATSAPRNINVVTDLANIAPTVALTAPVDGASTPFGSPITLTATAEDSDGTIANVAFYDGNNLIGNATLVSGAYQLSWTNATEGNHVLTARATDNEAAVTSSSVVNIVVEPAENILPTVSITVPSGNTTITRGDPYEITATANDADGTIEKVEIYGNTALLNTYTQAPYTLKGLTSDVPVGTYTIVAKAYDNQGGEATSLPIVITVEAPTGQNELPEVNITTPNTDVTIIRGAPYEITATASDTDGTITKVEIYSNGGLLSELAAAPYTLSGSTAEVPLGTYVITAKAYDNLGGEATSGPVSITISPNVNPNNIAPQVRLIGPNSVSQTSSYIISAIASDADGTISKVEFLSGESVIAVDTQAPYVVSGSAAQVPVGVYNITAKAYDDQGAVTISQPIVITVTP